MFSIGKELMYCTAVVDFLLWSVMFPTSGRFFFQWGILLSNQNWTEHQDVIFFLGLSFIHVHSHLPSLPSMLMSCFSTVFFWRIYVAIQEECLRETLQADRFQRHAKVAPTSELGLVGFDGSVLLQIPIVHLDQIEKSHTGSRPDADFPLQVSGVTTFWRL